MKNNESKIKTSYMKNIAVPLKYTECKLEQATTR